MGGKKNKQEKGKLLKKSYLYTILNKYETFEVKPLLFIHLVLEFTCYLDWFVVCYWKVAYLSFSIKGFESIK